MAQTIAETFTQKGIAEGEAKGKAEGIVEGEARAVIAVLEVRFGSVPASLKKKVASMRKLEHAIKLCATCESLKAFEKAL